MNEEILRKLDRIERMLFTLLNSEQKELFKNEKIKEYEVNLKIENKVLEVLSEGVISNE